VQQLTQPYLLDGKVSPKAAASGDRRIPARLMIAAGVIVLMVRRMLRKLPSDPNG